MAIAMTQPEKLERDKQFMVESMHAVCMALAQETDRHGRPYLIPRMDYIARPIVGARVLTLRIQRMNPKNTKRVLKVQSVLPQWLKLEHGLEVRIAQDSGDILIEIPKPQETWQSVNMAMLERLPVKGNGIVIGQGMFGRPMTMPVLSTDFQRALWAGRSRSGKTVNQMLLAYQIVKRGMGSIAIVDVSKKGEDWSSFENLPQLIAPPIYEMDEAARFFAWLEGELVRRARLKDKGRKIWIFIDEIASITALGEFDWVLKEAARVGASLGIHLMAATQRPDKEALPKHIKANMGARVCGAVSGGSESTYALDVKQAGANLLAGYGDLLGTTGNGIVSRFTGGMITASDFDRLERGQHRNILTESGPVSSISGYAENIPAPRRITPAQPEKKQVGRPSRQMTIDEIVYAMFECTSINELQSKFGMGASAAKNLQGLGKRFRASAFGQGYLALPECTNERKKLK